jgi:acyl carrier protein
MQVRGFRVEPAEVEAVLAAQPEVREAAVAAARDAGGASILVAYVAGTLSAEALQERLRAVLPDAMVPSRIVDVAGLPRTATGKVDRRALAALAASDAAAAHDDGAPFQPPITPVETALAGLWAEVIGVARVGRDQSFFALGGHSLSAARVIARMRDAFDVEIEVADLFERPRLAALAEHVDAQVRAREEVLNQLVDEIGELSPEELQAILDAAGTADAETSL